MVAVEPLVAVVVGKSRRHGEEISSPDFTVNAGFDGAGSADFLAPGNTLEVGEAGMIRVVLRVDSAGRPGPYYCSSPARATSPAGTPVTDISQDGDDVDPDGDGDPSDNSDPTPILFPLNVIEILLSLAAVRHLRRPATGV